MEILERGPRISLSPPIQFSFLRKEGHPMSMPPHWWRLSILPVLWLAGIGTGIASAASYYVSPSGRSSGDGSISNPWDLQTALWQPATVHPGDTIWMRGGVYRGRYTSLLVGTSSSPIVVRQYPGERATIDGGNPGDRTTLIANGSYTWFWGFEVMSSNTKRFSSQSGSWVTDIGFGPGVDSESSSNGLKFINLVIHDTAGGIALFSNAKNTEVYGCLVYYNGWKGTDRGHGHGIYTQNQAPSWKWFLDNIVFGNFACGIQAYGSAAAYLDNFDIEGNTIFKSGEPIAQQQQDLLVGGDRVTNNPNILSNYLWEPNGGASSTFCLGYIGWAYNAVVKNNYFPVNTYWGALSALTSTGNLFAYYQTRLVESLYPSNTYLHARPTGTRVFIRPNQFEAGRANVTVYNWGLASSVAVDLSGVVPVGHRYEIRNAHNFFGSPVVSGTYSGGSVSVPMSNLPSAAPQGMSAPPPTGPEFNAFVVLTVS
jgi:hypothetical protein